MDNEKLNKILEKLDDINKLRNELKEWKKEMNTRMDKNEQSIEHAHKEISDLKTQVSGCASYRRVAELREDFENESIKNRVQSYKYNLIFSGIPGDEKTKYDTEEVIRDFLKTKLKIEANIADYLIIQDTHRMGKKKSDRPRNIVVRFAQMSDRDNVLQSSKHLKEFKSTKTLDDGRTITYQTYKVQDHLPMELVDQKNKLWPAFKRAAQYGHRRQFRVMGARIYLFVNGHKYIPGLNVITEQGIMIKQNQSPSLSTANDTSSQNSSPGQASGTE